MPRTVPGRAALAAAVLLPLAAGIAACGSEAPPTVSVPAASTGAATANAQGSSTQVGAFLEVIGARIPAPAAHARQAQVEMTLVNSNTSGTAELTTVSTASAQASEFTRSGKVVTALTIPTSAGFAVPVGPPNPDRVLLTGLRDSLKVGQFVSLSLTFGSAGHVTLKVPVVAQP